MSPIAALYALFSAALGVVRAMPFTVTFYALRPGLGEVTVTVHRVERGSLIAYTGAPAVALGAARTVKGYPKPDGFRVMDADGRTVLNYVGRGAQG